MCASWVKKYDPDLIAKGFESIRAKFGQGITIGPLHGPQFDGTRFYEYKILLLSASELDCSILEKDKDEIVHGAIFEAAKRGQITSQALLSCISKAEAVFLRRPNRRYTILSSLSIEPNESLTRRNVSGVTITFSGTEPSNIDVQAVANDAKSYLGIEPPHYRTFVKIGVSARSDSEAVGRATNALELLVGIWNLFYNIQTPVRLQLAGRNDTPVNEIRIGPVHSLHEPNGKRHSPLLWFRPSETVRSAAKWKSLKRDWEHLQKFEHYVRTRAKLITDKFDVGDSIRWYSRALSDGDPENAFLKLWSLLEDLTGTREKRYDTTIRRVLFLVSGREYHNQVLEHLRDRRNEIVHAASVSQDAYIHVYQLKNYVEHVLLFLLRNLAKFDSIDDLHAALDLPFKTSDLRSRIQLAEKAFTFRSAMEQKAV